MAWEENSCICLNMQLIAILSRIGVEIHEKSTKPVDIVDNYCKTLINNRKLSTHLWITMLG